MSLSRKNSSEEIVEHKNPLFMRKSNSNNAKQLNLKISDMFSEEEKTNLNHIQQAKANSLETPGSPMARSRSSTASTPTTPSTATAPAPASPTKSHHFPFSRLSLKMKNLNRKSVEIEPGFLRVASAPHAPSAISHRSPQRRNSMEFSREVSFRYRAGSDASAPNFNAIESDLTHAIGYAVMSGSASFSAPPFDPPLLQVFDDESCSSIVYADEKKKVVAAATIDQLIFLLAGYNAPDKDFIVQFLRTHHRFVNSREFLQKLINRYNLPAAQNISEEEYIKRKKIVQVRIINVLKKWIELQLSDFQRDRKLVSMLQQFVNTLLQTGGTEAVWASNLQIALLQSEVEQENPSTVVSGEKEPPKPILPKNMIVRLMQFLDVNMTEMARQLTLIDSWALSKVQFGEYYNKRWCGNEKEKLAPNLLEIIERFNKTSFWIASEIVRQNDVKVRVKILRKSIKLLRNLLEIGNMQGVMAVYSALNITPIQRLHETWKQLPNKYSLILKSVGDLVSSSQNYKNYREHVRNATGPFIPFQLVYLSDLTFLEEAPDILDNGMVNFKKMGLIGSLLHDVHSFQTIKYTYTPVQCIQEFVLQSVNGACDEDQLYTISKTIEPRREV